VAQPQWEDPRGVRKWRARLDSLTSEPVLSLLSNYIPCAKTLANSTALTSAEEGGQAAARARQERSGPGHRPRATPDHHRRVGGLPKADKTLTADEPHPAAVPHPAREAEAPAAAPQQAQEAGRLIASARWPTPPEAQYVQRRRPDRYLPIRWNGGYGDKTLAVGGWRISRGYSGLGLPFAFLA
jgi:hypothetical protein